jgi:hypothetical protein
MRDRDNKGFKEYHKYIKNVEERVEDHKRKERHLSEIEFENYKKQRL